MEWKYIDLAFTKELQSEWEARGFGYWETKQWIDIGFKPADYALVAWLRNNNYDPLELLNFGDAKELRARFKESEQSEPSQPNLPLKTMSWFSAENNKKWIMLLGMGLLALFLLSK